MNKDEFTSILEKNHKDAYRWTLNQCQYNKPLAEDVLQEAYIKAFNNIHNLKDKACFKVWLFQIIKTTTIDSYRKESKFNHIEGEFCEEEYSKSGSQHLKLKRKRSLEYAGTIISKLSKREREVVELVIFSELTLKETAEVLGLTEGTVSSYYKRAKKALKGEVIKSRQLGCPDFEHTITHFIDKAS